MPTQSGKLLQPIDYFIEIGCDTGVVETGTANDNERNTKSVRRFGFCNETPGSAGFFCHHAINLPIFPEDLVELS